MPFTPHTPADIQKMLAEIGVQSIEDLFDEIPKDLRVEGLDKSIVPDTISEMALSREMQTLAKKDVGGLCFIGAGAYEHHIPAAVWQIASRGEYLTAYTPYQAEASQGTLQLLYEYQSMMASLMGMDVSNASLYDGASALAEAILMSVRLAKKNTPKRVLVPRTLHPHYRQTLTTILTQLDIEINEVDYDKSSGTINAEQLQRYEEAGFAALVIMQPNFFGQLEDVDFLTNFAHQHQALAIACVNPMAMALLKEPGQWGKNGADIACGEGQPLGIPLASGGPYFGFICCKQDFVRQMPGRIIGQTVDKNGLRGFALTLQAREQHIRRSKATSNICTNQGLLVTAATIYMSLLGAEGLHKVAAASYTNAHQLAKQLQTIPGVQLIFNNVFFHEFIIQLPIPVTKVLAKMAKAGIQAGFDVSHDYPELENALLICVTETKNQTDLTDYQRELMLALAAE